jgi:hypothetical protein
VTVAELSCLAGTEGGFRGWGLGVGGEFWESGERCFYFISALFPWMHSIRHLSSQQQG